MKLFISLTSSLREQDFLTISSVNIVQELKRSVFERADNAVGNGNKNTVCGYQHLAAGA